MAVNRDSFTVGTEVGIMTYSTLITIANNVATVAFALAEWPIAVDAIMNLGLRWCIRDWFVDRGESVARMDMLRALDAGRAIIPVRASQAFVANANDVLITPITDGMVVSSTSCLANLKDKLPEAGILRERFEGMAWMMTMFESQMA